MNGFSPFLLLVSVAQASTGQTVVNALTGGIDEFIRRRAPGQVKVSPMYDRKTQAPLVWIHLRKAPRLAVDNEFYNLSSIPGMNETNITSVLVPAKKFVLPDIQHMMGSSLLETKFDPLMIQNGLYLAMPLRNPPQETVNIVAAEDTRSISNIADMFRKKRETKRLQKGFNNLIREIATGG